MRNKSSGRQEAKSRIYKFGGKIVNPILQFMPRSLSRPLQEMIRRVFPHPLDQLTVNTILAGPLKGYKIYANTLRSKAYILGDHEPGVTKWITQNLKPENTALDIGSHEGYFMLLMAKQVRTSGYVYAFEPIPTLFNGLLKTKAANHLRNIAIENFAVGAETKIEKIFLQENDRSASHSLTLPSKHGTSMDIHVKTLDLYFSELNWPRVDLVKIDVEGYETESIVGMLELLERHLPKLIIELHLWEDPISALKMMVDLGYELEFLSGKGISLKEITEFRKRGLVETLIITAAAN